MNDVVHIAIPATGEYRKWAEVTAASARAGSSLPVEVHFIDWTMIDRARLEELGSWHGSAIAFSRLYLAELFPSLDWVITCDADVLFRGDIADLWALRDESVSFIAHKDCPLPFQSYNREQYDWYVAHGMVIKDWSTYFADGLGLVNLKKWREKGYQREFERLAKVYRDWSSPDMMILNYVLQDDKKLLPIEWDCFSGDENADVEWSKSGAVHFVEDPPWNRYKITHLASDLVEEWWKVAERIGVAATCSGWHGCRNWFDWAWRRIVFVFFKHNQWMLRLDFRLWLHLRGTRGVDARPDCASVRHAKILHVVPGLAEPFNGIAVAARLLATSQDADIVEARWFAVRGANEAAEYEEVWVHSCWTPMVWCSCLRVLRSQTRLVRVTHANFDPMRHVWHGWKKHLVAPVERALMRRSACIVATCDAEVVWNQVFVPGAIESQIVDLKRFFKLDGLRDSSPAVLRTNAALHILFLGRRHPLKGIKYLEEAAKDLKDVELRVVSNAFGEEKETIWEWCDVLVLPTLSENFGLVVAEALERGKCVITTDGAPAWGDGNDYGGRLIYLKGYRDGTPEERVRLLKNAIEGLFK